MTPEILYEDNHLVVVNKPFGVLTHGDKTGDTPMEEFVSLYIKEKYKKPGNVYLKSVHRLDRPVSGVLMFARTSKGHERMSRQFKDRKVFKTYWALTAKKPQPNRGKVEHFLRKNFAKNFVEYHGKEVLNSKRASTEYHFLRKVGTNFLISLHPLTGRSHQLRVMLRSLNCPIVGDVKYGGKKSSNPRSIMLHSRSLKFDHPVTKEPVEIIASPPLLEEWDGV